MWPDRLTPRLRRLLGARARPLSDADRAKRDALEQRLLAQHRQRYPATAASGTKFSRSFALVGRLAIASVVLTVAGIAACQIPVDVDVELGRRIVFEVPADAEADARIEAVMRAIEQRSNADSIELRVRHHGGEAMRATLDVWGSTLDLDAVEAVLDEHGFAPDDVEDLALAGTVRTTLGDRLGHELLDLDLDLESMDVDEARQAILDQLDAQGFDGEAEVEVESDGGLHKVEIRLRHTPPPTP